MIYKNATVFIDNKFVKCDFEITNGVFNRIEDSISDENSTINGTEALPDGYIVVPGLVDIHTHGIMGYDFSTANREQMAYMKKCYISKGTTSLLPTLVTSAEKTYEKSIVDIVDSMDASSPFMGINMEGPFISKEKKGSHNESYIREINLELADKLWKLSKHSIKLMTAAPENHGFDELASYAKDKFKLSMGHTSCNLETAISAIETGVDHVTHLFNAMKPMNHREPSLVGAALNFPVMKEIICDGIHLDKYIIKMMFRNYADEICVISDSLSSCGLGDGEYLLGDMRVLVNDKKATLEDGTIAGSNITLLDSLRYLINIGVNEADAIRSVTSQPARSVGLYKSIGSIAVGRKADFLICDKGYNLIKVFKNGCI